MIEHTSIKYDRLLKDLTEPLLQHFGITYFCYQFVSCHGDWFTLGNNPDWLLHSAEQQFFRYDPSLVRPDHYQNSSISLPKNHPDTLFQQNMMTDAIEVFDIDHCLALIEPNALGCDFYFFAAPKHHLKVQEIYLSQLALLRKEYRHHLRTQLQPVYDDCLAQAVNLHDINPSGFNSGHNALQATDHFKQETEFLKAINTIPLLTPREYQCLQYYRQGLTAKQSARKLGLSYRTIEDHFEHIKAKYGVHSKRELLSTQGMHTSLG